MAELSLIVGIDVGGTNTDVVCLNGDQVLAAAKEPTTPGVTGGIKNAVGSLMRLLKKQGKPTKFRQVNIGTTHFLNAVINRHHLTPVSIFRLCGTASRSLEPCIEFPEDLKQAVYDSHYFLSGGFQFDGTAIGALDTNEILRAITELQSRNVTNIVVSCVFAPVNGDQENQVRDMIKQYYPEASLTLSHEIGQVGLLERENAAILNESLKPLCCRTIHAFRQALTEMDIQSPFFLTQNDGTIISADLAKEYPIFTFSSGPTNSMRGAALLSGVSHNAIVVDIGGTSTDVGYLMQGFPRESSSRSSLSGVSTNFRMPDVQSIGLGGGSLVRGDKEETISVGPQSVGYKLLSKAMVFGGSTLTATDIVVAAHLANVGDRERVQRIPESIVSSAVDVMHRMVEEIIDRTKISQDDIPVIIVGGGSILIDENRGLCGASHLIKPLHYQSANAVGAAISQVSGMVDYLVSTDEISREDAMKQAEEKARKAAVKNGADESTVEITERLSLGVAYLRGNVIRIKVKAVGNLASSQLKKEEAKMTCMISNTPTTDMKDAETMGRCESEPSDVDKDEEAMETSKDFQPYVDKDSGEWILSALDIEYISIGAGLLGSGGGGSPYIGKLRALKELRNGKKIRVIAPER